MRHAVVPWERLHLISVSDERQIARKAAFVQSFAKGLMVIRTFSGQSPHQTLSEVAASTGLTRAGARRILLTLEELGYVAVDGRHFRLTAKVLDLSAAFVAATPGWSRADIVLRSLLLADHMSATLNTLDGADLVVVSRAPGLVRRPARHDVGTRLPAVRTASGLVLAGVFPERLSREYRAALAQATDPPVLTALQQARTLGYVRWSDGIMPGITAFAVPVPAKREEPWAISLVGVTAELPTVGDDAEIIKRLRAAATELADA
jgi:IclR family transcriptional regulator, pca regulon regulatory protein